MDTKQAALELFESIGFLGPDQALKTDCTNKDEGKVSSQSVERVGVDASAYPRHLPPSKPGGPVVGPTTLLSVQHHQASLRPCSPILILS